MNTGIIVTLIGSLANVTLSALSGEGEISPVLQNLISSLTASGAALFSSLNSQNSPEELLNATVSTLQADLEAIENDTSVDPKMLVQVQEIIKLVKASIAGYQKAESITDPSTLTPL